MENLTWDQFENVGTPNLESLDSMEIDAVSGGHCNDGKVAFDYLKLGWSVYKAMTGNG